MSHTMRRRLLCGGAPASLRGCPSCASQIALEFGVRAVFLKGEHRRRLGTAFLNLHGEGGQSEGQSRRCRGEISAYNPHLELGIRAPLSSEEGEEGRGLLCPR